MYKTVSKQEFIAAFEDYGREDNFSYAGLDALFDWLEEIEEGDGQQIELDVIALCCEFSEYSSALEAVEDYLGREAFEDADIQSEDEAISWLEDHTTVIHVPGGGVIIQAF